jgi:hypothetical protein
LPIKRVKICGRPVARDHPSWFWKGVEAARLVLKSPLAMACDMLSDAPTLIRCNFGIARDPTVPGPYVLRPDAYPICDARG